MKNSNQFFVEHLNDLETYLSSSMKLKIDLDYNEIMKTEESLSMLFTELQSLYQNINTDKNLITI